MKCYNIMYIYIYTHWITYYIMCAKCNVITPAAFQLAPGRVGAALVARRVLHGEPAQGALAHVLAVRVVAALVGPCVDVPEREVRRLRGPRSGDLIGPDRVGVDR